MEIKMTYIDETDSAIMGLLQRDGNLTNLAMAETLGTSEATIRRRRARLEAEGFIRIAAAVNHLKLGYQSAAIIGIQADASKLSEIEERLKTISEIYFLGVTSGQYDFLLEVWLKSNADFVEFKQNKLGRIDGVMRVDVFNFLKVSKSFGWSGGLVEGLD